MRTNPHFREFLELDTQIPESVVNTPVKVAELGDLNLGGRDFIYLKEEKLMIVAMSDMNITSRLDAYLTNVSLIINKILQFSFPWEKKGEQTDNYVGVGAISVYRVTKDKDDQWRFDRMWTKTFPSQVNSLLNLGLLSQQINPLQIHDYYLN